MSLPDLFAVLIQTEFTPLSEREHCATFQIGERIARYISARQTRSLAGACHEAHQELAPAHLVPATQVIAAEIAPLLVISRSRAEHTVRQARDLTTDHPALLDLVRTGLLDLYRATLIDEIMRETLQPGTTTWHDIDDAITKIAPASTAAQLRRKLRRMIDAADPEAAARRHVKAKARRSVKTYPLPDGMALITATLSASDALHADAVLDVLADACWLPPAVSTQQGRRPHLRLTMSATTFAGLDNLPGDLHGYGPVTADLARQIAAHAGKTTCIVLPDGDHDCEHSPAPEPDTPPGSKVPTGPDVRREHAADQGPAVERSVHESDPRMPTPPGRRPTEDPRVWSFAGHGPGDQANGPNRALPYGPRQTLRDKVTGLFPTCCFPGCSRPAQQCDLDHVNPYDEGGSTCACNLAPCCRFHHRLKTIGGWHARFTTHDEPYPTGTIEWTSRLGRRYWRTPPVLPGANGWQPPASSRFAMPGDIGPNSDARTDGDRGTRNPDADSPGAVDPATLNPIASDRASDDPGTDVHDWIDQLDDPPDAGPEERRAIRERDWRSGLARLVRRGELDASALPSDPDSASADHDGTSGQPLRKAPPSAPPRGTPPSAPPRGTPPGTPPRGTRPGDGESGPPDGASRPAERACAPDCECHAPPF